MTSKLLGGVVVPLATPLTDDEKLDVPALQALVDHLLPDVDGFFLLGSSGEFALLRPDVARKVVDVAVERIAGRRPVLLGVGDTGTARVVDNISRLAHEGVDALVVTSGFYYPAADQVSITRHFRDVADAAPLPVLLYNIPQNTAGNMTPDTVVTLASHPNIVGLKDSWGDVIQFTATLLADLPADFVVFQGREELTGVSRYLGAAGVVSALANLAPRLLRNVMDAVDAGDRDTALVAQRAVNEAAAVFAQGHWLTALKCALAELGFGSGRAARPLPSCSEGQQQAIRRIVTEQRLDARRL